MRPSKKSVQDVAVVRQQLLTNVSGCCGAAGSAGGLNNTHSSRI